MDLDGSEHWTVVGILIHLTDSSLLNLFITLFLSNSVLLSFYTLFYSLWLHTVTPNGIFVCRGYRAYPMHYSFIQLNDSFSAAPTHSFDSSLKTQNRFFQWRGRFRWVCPTNQILTYSPYSKSIGSWYHHSLKSCFWIVHLKDWSKIPSDTPLVPSYLEVCVTASGVIVLHYCNNNQGNIFFKGIRK